MIELKPEYELMEYEQELEWEEEFKHLNNKTLDFQKFLNTFYNMNTNNLTSFQKHILKTIKKSYGLFYSKPYEKDFKLSSGLIRAQLKELVDMDLIDIYSFVKVINGNFISFKYVRLHLDEELIKEYDDFHEGELF